MVDGRHKNVTWNLPSGSPYSWDTVKTAVLMDIRDELRALRRIFECANSLGMPAVLRQVAANTKKRKRKVTRAA